MTDFEVGDVVTWAGRGGQQRVGQVVAVVPAGVHPTSLGWNWLGETAHRYRVMADFEVAWVRQTVSYLVEVPAKTRHGKAELHWPRAKSLKPAQPGLPAF